MFSFTIGQKMMPNNHCAARCRPRSSNMPYFGRSNTTFDNSSDLAGTSRNDVQAPNACEWCLRGETLVTSGKGIVSGGYLVEQPMSGLDRAGATTLSFLGWRAAGGSARSDPGYRDSCRYGIELHMTAARLRATSNPSRWKDVLTYLHST